MRRCLPLAIVVASCCVPPAAGAWSWTVPGFPFAVGHDDAGSVIVGVQRRHPVVYSIATVNDRPRVRWKYRGRRRDRPQALGVFPDGDVLTAGQTLSTGNDGLFAARIAGDTGRARWRWSDFAGDPRGGALVAATVPGPTGDVFLAPQFVDEDPTRESEFTVVALAGATGSERWRSILADVARVDRLRVDAAGDVIAITPRYANGGPTIVKLSGSTGAVLWRRDLPDEFLTDATLAESGDVLLAISPYAVADVVRLDGSSGGQIWRMRVPGFQGITRVRAHAHDVIVGGYGGSGQAFAVAAVDVASGAQRWFYGAGMGGTVFGLSSGPDDAIVAVGNVFDPTSCNDGRAVGLDGATGGLRWSQTVDGTFTADHCTPCPRGGCSPVDDDYLFAVDVDATGQLLIEGQKLDARPHGRPRHVQFVTRAPIPGARVVSSPRG